MVKNAHQHLLLEIMKFCKEMYKWRKRMYIQQLNLSENAGIKTKLDLRTRLHQQVPQLLVLMIGINGSLQ